MQMVPDRLWKILEPPLPADPSKPKGGRPRVPDRAALAGILFVLRTGCPWSYVPQEMGCGCGSTCCCGCATGKRPACGRGSSASCCSV